MTVVSSRDGDIRNGGIASPQIDSNSNRMSLFITVREMQMAALLLLCEYFSTNCTHF